MLRSGASFKTGRMPDFVRSTVPEGAVDAHVHAFPPRMFGAVWNYFETRDWTVHREPVERIADTLRTHGVTCAIGLSYPHKTGVARPLNAFMESVGREIPLFRPFASVHPDDGDFRESVDEALASPHIHGFKFQPLVQRFDINDPRLDYLYGACAERGVPLMMHVGRAPEGNEFVGAAFFARLMKRFPTLRACVAHMGAPDYDVFSRDAG
ncbi:MAG: amidohydrolase [Deltaproteobacteria bacterium]|nr:amidohydrolase [Deltaproteobacteria bacterium]